MLATWVKQSKSFRFKETSTLNVVSVLTDNFENNFKCGYSKGKVSVTAKPWNKVVRFKPHPLIQLLDSEESKACNGYGSRCRRQLHRSLHKDFCLDRFTLARRYYKLLFFHLRRSQLSKNEHCQHVVICTFLCISDAKHSSSATLILWKLQVFIFIVDKQKKVHNTLVVLAKAVTIAYAQC